MPLSVRRRSFAVLPLILLLAPGCGFVRDVAAQQNPSPSPAPAGSITAELATLQVVAGRKSARGYDRGCGKAEACSFGPAWSDNHNGPGGHDGCDTRNNVLSRQLAQVTYKAGRKQCVVLSGQLLEPYTGKQVQFRKAEASKVQIDHIYPLARAWDLGASNWPLQRRVDFANDLTDNLLAVDGSANASKSDQGPGEWLPINKAYRCTYVLRYLHVANKYDLPITRDDQQSAKVIARTC
ncbi:HNH endonuclease family protein [Kribbella sancticallisti]|uniref:HNH endonuclease family protein n=1 Tax=Kribbella sancticallisti TaxID=460087 RepID=UPI0031E077F2